MQLQHKDGQTPRQSLTYILKRFTHNNTHVAHVSYTQESMTKE